MEDNGSDGIHEKCTVLDLSSLLTRIQSDLYPLLFLSPFLPHVRREIDTKAIVYSIFVCIRFIKIVCLSISLLTRERKGEKKTRGSNSI